MKNGIKIFKLLLTIFFFFIVYQGFINNQNFIFTHPEQGKPSDLVKQLFNDYRLLRFDNADSYTIGSISKWINDIKRFLLEAPINKLEEFKSQFRLLSDLRIYDEYIKGNIAFVSSLWVYKAPPDSNYLYKIRDNIYLLEKINNRWFIKNVKFNGEHILHDKSKARQIEEQARQADQRRGNRSR
jgi:hypothetical protein